MGKQIYFHEKTFLKSKQDFQIGIENVLTMLVIAGQVIAGEVSSIPQIPILLQGMSLESPLSVGQMVITAGQNRKSWLDNPSESITKQELASKLVSDGIQKYPCFKQKTGSVKLSEYVNILTLLTTIQSPGIS